MKKAVIFDLFGVLVIRDTANAELIELVAELKKKGIKIFVLSNADVELAAQQMKKYPFINELADKFYYSGQSGFIKPDPRAYKVVLEENNLKPEECIYFDDGESRVAAAQALGIESHLFVGVEDVRKKIQ